MFLALCGAQKSAIPLWISSRSPASFFSLTQGIAWWRTSSCRSSSNSGRQEFKQDVLRNNENTKSAGTTADKTRWHVRWRVWRRVRAWKSGLLSVTRPKSSAGLRQPTWRLGRRDQIEWRGPIDAWRPCAGIGLGWVGLG